MSAQRAARSFVRTVKAAARRKYTPEEKIRIVLEGFRREVTVGDLCRREGIKPHSYYAWTKEFMEAGEGAVDPGRCAGRHAAGGTPTQERECRAEAVGGGVVPGGVPSQKNGHTDTPRRRWYQRMSALEKTEVLAG